MKNKKLEKIFAWINVVIQPACLVLYLGWIETGYTFCVSLIAISLGCAIFDLITIKKEKYSTFLFTIAEFIILVLFAIITKRAVYIGLVGSIFCILNIVVIYNNQQRLCQEEVAHTQQLIKAKQEEKETKKKKLFSSWTLIKEDYPEIYNYIYELISVAEEYKDTCYVVECESLKEYRKYEYNQEALLDELFNCNILQLSYKLFEKRIKIVQWAHDVDAYNEESVFHLAWEDFVTRVGASGTPDSEHPCCHRLIKCPVNIWYETPQGKNHYKKTYVFSEEEVVKALKDRMQKNQEKQLNKYGIPKEDVDIERKKLSSKLRFQVFKRDNYTCQICGRSAQDGVQLHCDHIKPVAKGGKTELDNLQTLCQECNLGKGVDEL